MTDEVLSPDDFPVLPAQSFTPIDIIPIAITRPRVLHEEKT